ncbi:MAG TPA: hypothetical protein VEI28_01135 [Thermodesulfovibrionales bacterium]|nr:hypothetical protein [Thermodesulfovibrionales bacterium]
MDTILAEKKRRGEPRITLNDAFKVVLTIVSIAVTFTIVRPALSDYYYSPRITELDKERLVRASRITPEDAWYHYLLGFLDYSAHDRPGTERAIGHYLLSLKRNPTDSHTWLAIAKAYRDMDRTSDASNALRKAYYLDRNTPDVIWELALFLLLDDKQDEALPLLKRYIMMVPEEQANVYALCYIMRVKPLSILNDLVPADHSFYNRYLAFLMENKLFNEFPEVWKRIRAYNPDRSEYLNYCDFLIALGEIGEGLALWDDYAKKFLDVNKRPEGELLWNGDFELPIENGGFDWKIGKADGVRIYRDKDIKWTGFASLNVNFSGNTNPGISLVQQVVPVTQGQRYKLTGYIRTEKITTQNGIVFEASNYLCDPFIKKTEPVTGTTLWKKVELEFTTPQKCKAITIAVKRERSEKFDNKISGDAWIDSLSVIQIKPK